ncbi:MAG: PepSY-associated TM helix domain-containing protein, partial [Sphingobium sp.]
MKASLRQSMSWLHTWSGLLFGWLLFTMFVTGTAAYFNEEITRWMQPELKGRAASAEAVEGALRYLERTAPDAKSWFISPPGRRTQTTNVFWQPADDGGEKRRRRRDTSAQLDSEGNKVEARDTRGGFFLYRFHFDLHYMPVIWARYLVGLAAMFMLVAIVSGVITHKKIFTDFFML